MEERGRPASENRIIKLGNVKVRHPGIKKTPCLVVDTGYVGETRALSAELIGEIALAQNLNTTRPSHLLIIDSGEHPGQVAGVPNMTGGEDHIALTWINKGRTAKMNLATLFTLKAIQVPAGARMVIEVYRENDPDYGAVLGMKIQGAEFVPKQKGKPRKKKEEPANVPAAQPETTK